MSAPVLVTAADVLRGALAELRRPIDPLTGNGWQRGGYGTRDTCKCSAGAIYVAGGDSPRGTPHNRVLAAFSVLAKVVGYPGASEGKIIHWNDQPSRTFPEVESAFERAIELAEADAR
ncbi:DUF6197 family protein [Mycobacteroides abscessus]|uniref:DUF6197 family protein n=1 Tax=Mycobacteroides abscessus TaxID=36809 RepID=UPI000C260A94|nr:hypothetical protein [Mycobacteroides abscessus]